MITNVQRDGVYAIPGTTRRLSWCTPIAVSSAAGQMNAHDAVNYDFGAVVGNHQQSNTLTGGQYTAIGLYIQQPVSERFPYRVKAKVETTNEATMFGMIMLGYRPSSGTSGTDDTIENPIYLPFKDSFDDLLVIEPNPSGLEDRALAIAVCAVSKGALTNNSIMASLSVQNLGVRPPTMHNAVS